MSTSYHRLPKSRPQLTGLVWVVLLHLLLFWALHAGLSRTDTDPWPTVVQALLLTDSRPAAPEPPPPPATIPPPAPAQAPPKTAPAQTPAAEQRPAIDLPQVTTTAPAPTPSALTASPPSAPSAAPAPVITPTPNPVIAAPPRPAAPAAAPTAAGLNIHQCDKPEYPSASRRLEEEGTVTLRFLVGVDGQVIRSEIEKSSGHKRLDEAARAGLSKCQFRPATVDGKPEQAWASIRYTWRLE